MGTGKNTAASLICCGKHPDACPAGEEREGTMQMKEAADASCRKMSVSPISVIRVDTEDYGRFESFFDPVDNSTS